MSSPSSTPTATPFRACVGDCGQDEEVTVDELLTMVNVALGIAPVSACRTGNPNGDREITIDEILTAVSNALNGCANAFKPTSTMRPSPTPTPRPTSSPTPGFHAPVVTDFTCAGLSVCVIGRTARLHFAFVDQDANASGWRITFQFPGNDYQPFSGVISPPSGRGERDEEFTFSCGDTCEPYQVTADLEVDDTTGLKGFAPQTILIYVNPYNR
jgi:hypothetical protein